MSFPTTSAIAGIQTRKLNDVPSNTNRGGDMRVLLTPAQTGNRHHILGQLTLAPGEKVANHRHDYGEESIFILQGQGTLHSGDECFRLRPGLAALIPKGTPHEVQNDGKRPLKLVFASAPLAPSPAQGHQNLTGNEGNLRLAQANGCGYVPVSDSAYIFYRAAGLDCQATPVILLHGNRDNHTHFTEMQAALSKVAPVLAIDLRGHGLSAKLDCPLSADLFASDLRSLIESFGWQRVILVGHSLGAVTAMQYSLRYRDGVEALVLMGAAAHYKMRWKRPPVSEETYPQVIEESNRRAGPVFFLEDYPLVRERVIASWSSILFKVHKNLIREVHPDFREKLQDIQVPVLVIAGEKDRSTTVEEGQWLTDHLPNARMETITNTGHFMFMERPDQVNALVLKFLAEVEAGAEARRSAPEEGRRGHTQNSILIHAPRAFVFQRTNDLESWESLFSEYQKVEILERTPRAYLFRLTTKPNPSGESWSWVSHRKMVVEEWRATAARVDSDFPFEYMRLEWFYDEDPDGCVMRWVQDFQVAENAPFGAAAAFAHINRNSREQMARIKGILEEAFQASQPGERSKS